MTEKRLGSEEVVACGRCLDEKMGIYKKVVPISVDVKVAREDVIRWSGVHACVRDCAHSCV